MKQVDYQNNDFNDLSYLKSAQQVMPILEQAMKDRLFDFLEGGRRISDALDYLNVNRTSGVALFQILKEVGLVVLDDTFISNAPVSDKYLVTSSVDYSGEAFLSGNENPRFLAEKLKPMLEHYDGSVYVDKTDRYFSTPDLILSLKQKELNVNELAERTEGKGPNLVLIGSDVERFFYTLNNDTMVGILGAFEEYAGLQAAVGWYQQTLIGVRDVKLSSKSVQGWATKHQLHHTPILPLTQRTSVVFLTKDPKQLEKLSITKEQQVVAQLKTLPIHSITKIDTQDIVTAEWVVDHCRFGCSSYGSKCCPPNSPTQEETKTLFQEYSKAYLIEGQPPGRDFQRHMLHVEKIAFKQGFYKAFVYWAGPCDLCSECLPPAPPLKCTATRPSMESAGIDVFATVSKQGITLRTLNARNQYVKYFGLLLLE
jgi:predicted metal-binding protein